MGVPSVKGRLLVATPALEDPNFHRSVLLVLEHGEEGALAVVLNRPSEMDLSEPVPEWEPFAAPPPVVFFGGPVAPGTAICLARSGAGTEDAADEAQGWTRLFGPIGALDIGRSPPDVAQPIDDIRVFSGHAGWGPGQLEAEIAQGAWFVVDAHPGDALSDQPLDLWRRVLRRQPGRVALFSAFPLDPLLN